MSSTLAGIALVAAALQPVADGTLCSGPHELFTDREGGLLSCGDDDGMYVLNEACISTGAEHGFAMEALAHTGSSDPRWRR